MLSPESGDRESAPPGDPMDVINLLITALGRDHEDLLASRVVCCSLARQIDVVFDEACLSLRLGRPTATLAFLALLCVLSTDGVDQPGDTAGCSAGCRGVCEACASASSAEKPPGVPRFVNRAGNTEEAGIDAGRGVPLPSPPPTHPLSPSIPTPYVRNCDTRIALSPLFLSQQRLTAHVQGLHGYGCRD